MFEDIIIPSMRPCEAFPIVPLINFRNGCDGTINILPSLVNIVNKPKIVGKNSQNFRICGPFNLIPYPGEGIDHFPETVISPPMTLTRASKAIVSPSQIVIVHHDSLPLLLTTTFNSDWDRHVHHHVEFVGPSHHRLKHGITNLLPVEGDFLFLDCQHNEHYGHFIADVLSMAWAYPFLVSLGIPQLKVLVNFTLKRYMIDLLIAAGIPEQAIMQVEQPLEVERLYVASKSYLTQGWTSPYAIETWQKIRRNLDQGSNIEKVHISRSRNPARHLSDSELIDDIFARAGFHILHPQEHSIAEQVSIIANAKYISGIDGSNMFTLAFQNKLEKSFYITSPNLIHFALSFLQSAYRSETTLYIGDSATHGVHDAWHVDRIDLEGQISNWLSQL